MTTKEVAERLVGLCREGKNLQAIEELYHDNIVSIEPEGAQNPRVEGKKALIEKEKGFFDSVEKVHSSFTSDPIVAKDHFSVSMGMDITFKGIGRFAIDEIAVYEVKDGKIIREEFFFNMH
ncbi:MAG: nuclear transport factor 2 family protein [Vicingaceae bacterium]